MKIFKRICFLTISVLTLVSCGGGNDNDSPITPEVPSVGGASGSNIAYRIEVPKRNEENIFIQHSTKVNGDSVMTYCLEYNQKKCHSRWVAFRFDAKTKINDKDNVSRNDNFLDDPSLPKEAQIGTNSFGTTYYNNAGNTVKTKSKNLDRGHICASDDRKYVQEANDQTFYMSNMSPQFNDFNANFWQAFEYKVQTLGRSEIFADTLYVVKGGTIDEKVNGGKDDGTLGYVKRQNGKQVVIPKYYFMALLCLRNNRYKAIGFLIEHKDNEYPYGSGKDVPNSALAECAVSIDELENFVGIDFFHNLPDDVETSVEANFTLSEWGL